MNSVDKRSIDKRKSRGQALVEFSLAIVIFLMLLMGVFDLGRAIYQYNGVAQAAREIARVTSVHPGADFRTTVGRSAETNAVIGTQSRLIPNLQDPEITCVDIDGTEILATCTAKFWVNVSIEAPYTPITPLLGLTGTWNLFSSSTSAQLQEVPAP